MIEWIDSLSWFWIAGALWVLASIGLGLVVGPLIHGVNPTDEEPYR